MYLPRPNFTNNTSPEQIKIYLVTLVEFLEKILMKLEEKTDGEENV